jgi:DNA-binding PadR family transcriptional regulator
MGRGVHAMAKRRKVDNLMGLAILSAVAFRPMHPYEMASALRGWGKDNDVPIKWGSLYTVVRNLAKHGLLEEVGSTREGRRPERTTYRITEAGRAELVDWTRELLSAVEPEFPRFRAGLSVLSVMPPDEAIALLQQRLAALEAEIARVDAELDHDRPDVPRLFLVEVEYGQALLHAEAAWVRSLLDDLTSGALPEVAAWRHMHETGEVPEEVRQLAQKKL